MTPTPLPSPEAVATFIATILPKAAPTVTVTHTVTPKPDDVPLTDHLQGWGTAAAVLVALGLAAVETRRRRRDQAEAEAQRAEDRADADRRLIAERAAADRRLQQQLDDVRERNRRQFIVDHLKKAAEYWAQGEIRQLPGILVAIPDQYATILRYLALGEDYRKIVGFPPLSDRTYAALEVQLTRRGLENHGRENYLIKKMQEQRRNLEKQGKSSAWASMHPRKVELLRVGYDYTRIKQAWLYEEIAENIAEILGGMQHVAGQDDAG